MNGMNGDIVILMIFLIILTIIIFTKALPFTLGNWQSDCFLRCHAECS